MGLRDLPWRCVDVLPRVNCKMQSVAWGDAKKYRGKVRHRNPRLPDPDGRYYLLEIKDWRQVELNPFLPRCDVNLTRWTN